VIVGMGIAMEVHKRVKVGVYFRVFLIYTLRYPRVFLIYASGYF
jgi:hypothetical protein